MKKILFATTALVATAGVAAADVSVSGRAAFGILDVDTGVPATTFTELRNNFDLYFTGTTETDGGVALSATIEMEGLGWGGTVPTGYAKTTAVGATTVFSATAGAMTFTFGNTDGAFDRAMTEAGRIAGIGYELWGGADFIDNNDLGQIARIEYAAGPVSAMLSYAGADDSTGIGVKYTGDLGGATVIVGAAYETQTTAGVANDYYGISAKATFGAFAVTAGYADSDNAAGPYQEAFNISAAYSANGLMVGATYMEDFNSDGFTVFGSYDLGGGASLFAQYGERNNSALKIASMGVAFDF